MKNIDNCEVLLEPYFHAHISLWGYDNSRAWRHQSLDQLQLSVDKTTTLIQARSSESKFVFVKEIAKDVGLSPNYFADQKQLQSFQHTFLLRHPEMSIPSLYRIYNKEFPDKTNIDFSNEGGFKQLYETYQYASKHSDTPPIVILADDLLEDPEKVLKYYCDHTGLPYKEGMSRWEPGPVEGWYPAEYYVNVFRSSGLGKLPRSSKHVVINDKEHCATVKKAIQDNIWYFEQMYEKRVEF